MPESPSEPPSGSDGLLQRQNEPVALRWLLAQRKMYRRARNWSYLRIFGVAVVAVIAPLVSIFFRSAAGYVGPLAAAYIVLARTIIATRETHWSNRAAAIQEKFDSFVLGLPPADLVLDEPSEEDISDATEGDFDQEIEKEELRNWYSCAEGINANAAAAIAQRSNAAYAERLLRAHARTFIIAPMIWATTITVASIIVGIGLLPFIAGVALPLLPALLGSYELSQEARKAADSRQLLAKKIEIAILGRRRGAVPISELRRYQDHLYLLRRGGPLVPEFLYFKGRERNNRAMTEAAMQLSARAVDATRSPS